MAQARTATSDDLPAVGRSLAAAFADDPVWEWLVSPKANWDKRAPAFYAAEASLRVERSEPPAGMVLVDEDVRGAALWAAPGQWRTTLRQTVRIAMPSVRIFRAGAIRGLKVLGAVERHHPDDVPHWYLNYLGTHPDHQGHGIGSALIAPVTERCDAEGLGAYLESSKESNLAFYARHGFEVTERIDLPGGPPMWLMWRDPKG